MPDPADTNPLAELLEATGISQNGLAKLLGVGHSQINQKVNGKRRLPRIEAIFFRSLLIAHQNGEDVQEIITRARR